MLILGSILAALAALLHVYIFVLESIRWTHPSTRRIFGVSEADAVVTRPLAFNQGFYNLFLAIAAAIGAGCILAGATVVGVTLALAGTGTMLAAALVLILSDRSKARAAATQGLLPLLAVIALVVGVA